MAHVPLVEGVRRTMALYRSPRLAYQKRSDALGFQHRNDDNTFRFVYDLTGFPSAE